MSPELLLILVPAFPLIGFVLLALSGQRLSNGLASRLATVSVGLAFVASLPLAPLVLGTAPSDQPAARPAVQVSIGRWIEAGRDLVRLTVAARDLPALTPIPADGVTTSWWAVDIPGLAGLVSETWDPKAVVGQRPLPSAIVAGTPLTRFNVPPGPGGFEPLVPRREVRFVVDAALRLDGLALLMVWVVTGVAFLIHLYAVGYMADDPHRRRFFSYLNLFVFGMLVLVLADNFLVLFVGWELVGLCSYLLIGFWFVDPRNARAGRKAFIVNRIGDVGFLVGLMLIWCVFGSLAYSVVLLDAPERLAMNGVLATAIALLLVAGAVGKSAQLPLYVWLPDAMAGPTPVSALIHAATMVTAGVYMIVRLYPLFVRAPAVLALVAAIGALTALMAGLAALAQNDIKRLLAYSTISQIGLMFLGAAAGALAGAMFHLATHALFKATLFLAAGGLVHALAHAVGGWSSEMPPQVDRPEQDLRLMGGLMPRQPLAASTLAVGALALAGLPPLAGFFSKERILEPVVERSADSPLWLALAVVGYATAAITALYAGRLLILVGLGQPRSGRALGAASVRLPTTMQLPTLALALLAAVAAPIGFAPGGASSLVDRLVAPSAQLEAVAHPATGSALGLSLLAVGLGLLGAWVAFASSWQVARQAVPGASRLRQLAANGFYLDAAYDRLIVQPFARAATVLWQRVDDGWIDGAVNGVGRALFSLALRQRLVQTGFVRQYALVILGGVLVLAALLWLLGM